MTSPQTQADANQALVQRFIEKAWNQGNVAIVDECVAADFVEHPLWPNIVPLGPMDASAREQLKHDITETRKGFPDLQITIDQLIQAEDKVITVLTNRGTPITGKPMSWVEINIDRIVGGKIVERWSLWDRLGFWQQLGIVGATPELMAQFPS
jgi:predicted SnoaL-like aldol condensation-catalyzing enzyme